MPISYRQTIQDLLRGLPTRKLDALKHLFWSELNYDRADTPLSTRDWSASLRGYLEGPPVLFATACDDDGFHVIYCRLTADQLLLTHERPVIARLLNEQPYALFVFSDHSQTNWHFVNVKYDQDGEARARRVFRRITVGPFERLRTATERLAMLDVAALSPGLTGVSPLALQQRHDEAFDVEAVTRDFFRTYHSIFEQVEAGVAGLVGEQRRLFTQRLFNRLLFIVFLERKGWLTFDGDHDYLQALWKDHLAQTRAGTPDNFYRDRLKLLFFSGLNTPNEVNIVDIKRSHVLEARIGRVPYLNGGLFEEQEEDKDARITVPDALFGLILDDLLYHYNFTVTESTPLDVEVAVDPEMLGKTFEELVTGRHESGSYYTPKPVVSFMCQEALKGYLETACPSETREAIRAFVESKDASGLRDPEAVLAALKAVKCCDLACGSGAYLIGMLHELLELRQALFTARSLDPLTTYQRKLEIIQNNLYGVDIDPFAVNIARLRLWLSLIVDFEGDTPPPLPNLDFKIEVGDSLLAPNPSGGLGTGFRQELVDQYFRSKSEYLMTHGSEKLALRKHVEELRSQIAAWAGRPTHMLGFDWALEYAEVFARGGFDIVLANPPYVRQELIKDAKLELSKRYPDVYDGRADLFVYFYARALQLLKSQGMMSFISSSKFLQTGYGRKLRKLLLDVTTIATVVDFGDLPVFEATTYPLVFVAQKTSPSQASEFRALTVKDIVAVGRLSEEIKTSAWLQPQTSLTIDPWSLVKPSALAILDKLRSSGDSLVELVGGHFYMGVKTGLNEVFVIDEGTRQRLITEDPKSSRLLKPWLRGRDIRRWCIDWAGLYVIFTYHGVNIKEYPSVEKYLSQYRHQLEQRATSANHAWYELQQPQMGVYSQFERPKIIYPHFNTRSNFAYDESGFFSNDRSYFIPNAPSYLLGLLNSKVIDYFLRQITPAVQQGYMEFREMYIGQIPVPRLAQVPSEAIERLTRRLIDVRGQGSQAIMWEQELNVLVYELYGLTKDEIAIVEEATQ